MGKLSIEPPHFDVEIPGERHPEQVRNQQQRRLPVHADECQYRHDDGEPQSDDEDDATPESSDDGRTPTSTPRSTPVGVRTPETARPFSSSPPYEMEKTPIRKNSVVQTGPNTQSGGFTSGFSNVWYSVGNVLRREHARNDSRQFAEHHAGRESRPLVSGNVERHTRVITFDGQRSVPSHVRKTRESVPESDVNSGATKGTKTTLSKFDRKYAPTLKNSSLTLFVRERNLDEVAVVGGEDLALELLAGLR